MQEIFSGIDRLAGEKGPLALATVINTWGSSPRGIGAKLVVNAVGDMAGSVSGGCVEGAVIEAAMEVIQTGVPQLLHFGVSDQSAWEVGLACGGEIEVFVRCLDRQIFEAIRRGYQRGLPSVLSVVIRGPEEHLGKELLLDEGVKATGEFAHSLLHILDSHARKALVGSSSSRHTATLVDGSEVEIFVDFMPPPPSLVVIGGVHIAIPLVTFARALGFRTIVIDPRRKFGNIDRFKHADQIFNAWPQHALSKLDLNHFTAVVVLTHDPKIDDLALKYVLTQPVFYIGALGSRKTQAARRQRLIESGLPADQVKRIKGPIGLNLGGRSPEEIALEIMAEIIQEKNLG